MRSDLRLAVAKSVGGLLVLGALGLGVSRCSFGQKEPSVYYCPPDDDVWGLRALFQARYEEPGLSVVDYEGQSIAVDGWAWGRHVEWATASLEVYLYSKARAMPSELVMSFTSSADVTKSTYKIRLSALSGEELVSSKLGDRLSQRASARTVSDASHRCDATSEQSVTVEVLAARGVVDTTARTIDRSFWRRFAVDIEWSNLGCGVGAVRGRAIFDVTAQGLVYNCGRSYFTLLGEYEPLPSDAGADADAASDAGVGEAAGGDASLDGG